MPSLKFSVTSSSLAPDVRHAAALSREIGFAGLLIDAYSPALRIPDLSGTGQREFLKILSDQNQQLVGLQVELGSKGFGPGADVDRLINGVRRAMEAARAMSAAVVCIDVGTLPEPVKAIKTTPAITPEQAGFLLLPEPITPATVQPVMQTPPPDPAFVGQVDGALAELGALADRTSVILAFSTELSSFDALSEALRRVHCPWFGVDLDPVAVLRDEWPSDEVFSRLGASIRHVRGKDAAKGSERRTKPAAVGQGDVAWEELIPSLDGAGYAGWVTVDPVDLPDRVAAARAALTRLRGI